MSTVIHLCQLLLHLCFCVLCIEAATFLDLSKDDVIFILKFEIRNSIFIGIKN